MSSPMEAIASPKKACSHKGFRPMHGSGVTCQTRTHQLVIVKSQPQGNGSPESMIDESSKKSIKPQRDSKKPADRFCLVKEWGRPLNTALAARQTVAG